MSMRVIICGGGVIGASIAYFLSLRGAQAIVVERTGLACAASGKSGGFLALDWCDRTPLQELARRSFDLHTSLVEELGGDWGYRRLTTYSGMMTEGAGASGPSRFIEVDWLSKRVLLDRRLGTSDTTAQVHPGQFTAAMMTAAGRRGAELRHGEVTGIDCTPDGGRVTGVRVDGNPLEADAVVIALGPWSILGSRWLPLPLVYGSKGHSIIFRTGDRLPPQALFLEAREAGGASHSPEIFPRADGTTWACAISGGTTLPLDPADVSPDDGVMDRLQALCGELSPVLAESEVVARQACFRPVTEDGLPLIGAIPQCSGAYVATGHSVWGILNAPATGEAMAELILDGAAREVDLSPFDPGRLQPFDPRRLLKDTARGRPAPRRARP